jgi:hypothetical protein
MPRVARESYKQEPERDGREYSTGTPFLVNASVEGPTPWKDSEIGRLCSWAFSRMLPWVGTIFELSNSTGMAIENLAELLQKSTPELRRNGIEARVWREPGRLQTVEIQRASSTATSVSEVTDRLNEHAAAVVSLPYSLNAEISGTNSSESTNFDAGSTLLRSQCSDEQCEGADTSGKRIWGLIAVCVLLLALALTVLAVNRSKLRSPFVSRAVARIVPPPNSESGPPARSSGTSDDDEASLIRAATAGDSASQHKLALQLSSPGAHGEEPPDPVSGYAWLVMALARGEAIDKAEVDQFTRNLKPQQIGTVRRLLGHMYENAVGCSVDLVQADMWYLLGVDAGDELSRAKSAAVEAQMSSNSIKEARDRSAKWLRQHTLAPPKR